MTIASNAKTKVYVGGTASMANIAAYDAETWTEIGSIEDAGSVGDTASEIKAEFLGDARVRKFKGARDAGSMKLEVGFNVSDLGQIALRLAATDDFPRNFKVVLNDKPNLTTGTNTEFFFAALVMSAEVGMGSSKGIVKQTFDLSISTEILLDPATAGA
jgi:hypothetical protein